MRIAIPAAGEGVRSKYLCSFMLLPLCIQLRKCRVVNNRLHRNDEIRTLAPGPSSLPDASGLGNNCSTMPHSPVGCRDLFIGLSKKSSPTRGDYQKNRFSTRKTGILTNNEVMGASRHRTKALGVLSQDSNTNVRSKTSL